MLNRTSSWDTQAEIQFIKNLGTGKNFYAGTKYGVLSSRKELLRKYIKSTELRKNWHGIDKDEVVRFAESCLKFE